VEVFVFGENPLQLPLGQVDLDNVMRLETGKESATRTGAHFWSLTIC